MTGPGTRTGLTYQQMVEYVGRVTDPIEEHMAAHDAWHRDRLTAEQQSRQAFQLAAAGLILTFASLVAFIVFALIHH